MPACPKLPHGTTRFDERLARNAALEQHWRETCRLVDQRDGGRCRVCDRRCSPLSATLTHRAERHHLIPLSRGGADHSSNILTLCKRCHEDRHLRSTLQLSGDADARDELGKLAGVKCERLENDVMTIFQWC